MRQFFVAGVLALVVSASGAWADEPRLPPPPRVATADFAALAEVRNPILSPNGHLIAAQETANGKTTLIVLNADQPESPAHAIDVGKADVAALRWAGNQRLLLTVWSSGDFFGFQLPFLRLLRIDAQTGASIVLDRKSRGMFAGNVLYSDPGGVWALVASQDDLESYPSVKRVDLSTGDAIVIEKAHDHVWDWYADDKGVVRAGVAYAGRRWTVWYRDKAEEKLHAVSGKFANNDDSAVDKFIFRGENSWIMTNERTGRFALYKYDTKTGAIGGALFEHPEVDIDDALYDRATGQIKAVKYEDDRSRIHWLDPEMGALQAKLDSALPNSVNLVTDWSDDDQKILIYSASASDPGRYFLLDRKAARMHPVVDPYPRIDPAAMAAVKPVRYRTRDGLVLHAYLTMPRGRATNGLPLVLMPHGGPFDRDHWEYDPIVQFLANRGYAVFQPEFRGSTGYGKDLVEKGYGQWGRKMQDDLNDGVDWLAASGQIDPKRVCIVGGSYGGYAAMWGAIRDPGRYRCAASMAGVSDVQALLRYDRKLFSATRYYREWRSHVAGDEQTDLRTVSPLVFASQLKIPLLIGHGERDQRVPVKQSRDMVAALTKAQADVTSVFYKESGHGFDSSADLDDWLRRLEAFLAKYNPA